MPRRARREFTQEFKAEAVTLVHTSGKTLPQIARDLDLTESALRTWVERAQPSTTGTSVSDAERHELAQLRKEVRVLRMERDLLKNLPGGPLRPVGLETPGVLSPLLPGWSDRLLFGDARAR